MEMFESNPVLWGFVFNAIGILGVAMILAAYFLLQLGKMKSDQIEHPLLNLCGAALILISLIWSWNLPSFVIECFWIAISLFGIIKILRNKKSADSSSDSVK